MRRCTITFSDEAWKTISRKRANYIIQGINKTITEVVNDAVEAMKQ